MAGFGSPCGACKFLRRKCVAGCVFAPYFRDEQGAAHFAAIHKVFGASNVGKLLMHLPLPDRFQAAITISYEAQARLQNPIYGCVAHIFALQQQILNLQAQVASLEAQTSKGLNATAINPPPPSHPHPQQVNPYNAFQPHQSQHSSHGFFINQTLGVAEMTTPSMDVEHSMNGIDPDFEMIGEDLLCPFGNEDFNCLDIQDSFWKSTYQGMEERLNF
ncbi:LOB domain-containing protein CRL1-like [Zingiber officinale]|uniref:LOB domain-containing protein n=1 Tax=Zingiber officinale TaxID=94328 RepID=A0A8J5GXQ4_ZINOF|nr:LOB domain-containing protein CRL1-like [Zingiber officinale]KAG6513733.1 hypothetical protein ZIOFF_024069 [Zingiber officinale]